MQQVLAGDVPDLFDLVRAKPIPAALERLHVVELRAGVDGRPLVPQSPVGLHVFVHDHSLYSRTPVRFPWEGTVSDGWRTGLNEGQRRAVEHPGGPVLVVAGAGTGKTWTLACRVAHLVECGVRPERLLLLTFTRRAAREMLARAGGLIGRDVLGRAWGGTFHAVANRLLRLYGRPIGVRPDFTVLDQADAADLMDLIRGELDLGSGDRRFPRKDTLAAVYSRTVNAGEKLALVLERSFPWCAPEIEGIRQVFRRYVKRKRDHNVLDYDDLLLHWEALVRTPGPAERVSALFDHVLVDEYQDTNALQARILKAMWPPGGNLMVVGDDAQAIYGFRSATVRNILEFPQVFPATRVVKLEQNYRSTPPLLRASNAVIAQSPERHAKELWSARSGARRPAIVTCLDESHQAEEVCRLVLDHREQGVALRRQAVLFRAAHHSDLVEVELARRNIPFVKYGGLKFLEAAHVKDALACLRIVENPFDEVGWFRVLGLLEGIGPATARRLLGELGVRREGQRSTAGADSSPIRRLRDHPPTVPVASRAELQRLGGVLADCSAPPALPVATQLERIRRFLEPIFLRRYTGAAGRVADLEQLERLAGEAPSRARFLTDLTLDPPHSTGDLAGPPLLDEDYLVLSTIHSAKGGEWDVVHVIHASDGMIPSDMATGSVDEIEEERRLFYVALTRARDALHVYTPLRYHRRQPRGLEDAHTYAQVTRFLPPPVRDHFDEHSAHRDAEGEDAPAGAAGSPRSVEILLADLWE
jgi:DNA helicase-2/ATP-dependent DNA helicase PcrA